MKKILFIAGLLLTSAATFAQAKVGTIDPEFIVTKMTEFPKMQEDLKAYNAELEGQMKTKVENYQAAIKVYQEGEATMLAADKKLKQDEIIKMENDIAKFRQNGSQLLQLRQTELLQPLYEKIGEHLNEIAQTQGYGQVFITGNDLAYINPEYDLTAAVMEKMGLKVE